MAKRQLIERKPITDIETWLEWRKEDITASIVGALFGLHPYETHYGLYARAMGAPPPDIKDWVSRQRGLIFEDAVGRTFQLKHPSMRVRKGHVYLRMPERRLGATPDYFLRRDDGTRGVLQCKTVAPFVFKKYWTAERPPTWIVLQVLLEMMLAQASFGYIAALEIDGYKFEFHEYPVERHPTAERRIYDAVEEFWRNVSIGKVPEPDYSRDGALLAAMNAHAIPGTTVDLRHDNMLPELLDERARLAQEIRDKEARKDEIETEIKAKIGEAETALVTGWRVSCKEIHKKEYTVKATSYRSLRATREETSPAVDDGRSESRGSGSAAHMDTDHSAPA
jgi:predicted phage-related endonuclease